MSLLLPLGLLGLLSIAVLIAIYIIRPNYQQKFISSTYVWKLSLKYRKRNIPVNKIRNIIIFLCQLLILASCAMLLARPVISAEEEIYSNEKVVILDASASMSARGSTSRYERALEEIRDFARATSEEGGNFSVIVASPTPYFAVQQARPETLVTTYEALDALAGACSYGTADMDAAFSLADEVVRSSPEAEVRLYTDTTYAVHTGVEVVNVAQDGEWNVGVLGCSVTLDNNGGYVISVDVGCYGNARQIEVVCEVADVNGSKTPALMRKSEMFNSALEEQTFVFGENEQLAALQERIHSYASIHVSVNESDSFLDDNDYYVYGGVKPTVRVQYASSSPNRFVRGAVYTARSEFADRISLEYTETSASGATEGYDYYIFEHVMPAVLPTDGAVLLLNPNAAPSGAKFETGNLITLPNPYYTLLPGTPHVTTSALKPEQITLAEYRRLFLTEGSGYETLLRYENDPILLYKNTPESKVAILALSVHNTNFALVPDGFALWMKKTFCEFLPDTFTGYDDKGQATVKYTYAVDERISLRARTDRLHVDGPGVSLDLTEFPYEFSATRPGTYTFTQTLKRKTENNVNVVQTENFFVGIAPYESNFTKTENALPRLGRMTRTENTDNDLLLWFAIAAVALLFLEWWLQSREYMR